MIASVGVLIIGSLYWDDETRRESWRNGRLDLGKSVNVSAPIRYGRKSNSRGDSYTMVFSELLSRDTALLGTAIVVPCKHSASSIEDVIIEAELLWAAETKSDKPTHEISAAWGCVAMMTNPNREISKDLLDGWSMHVSKKLRYGQLKCARDETLIVNNAGILNIPWPLKLDGAMVDLDILLATATNPTFGVDRRYPTAEEIADAWQSERGRCYGNYFWCNRKHNITTLQDVDIQRHLSSK